MDWPLTVSETAAVAQAVGVVGGAIAAVLTLRHAVKTWRRSLLPELHGQVQVRFAVAAHGSRAYELVIHNAGARVAKAPMFALAVRSWYAAGYLPPGFLLPGETVTVRTRLSAESDDEELSTGVLVCRDTEENTWAWDLMGKRRRIAYRSARWWRFWSRNPSASTIEDILQALHPELRVADLVELDHRVVEPVAPLTQQA